jgi:putative nucleotidyltransferase with HDIG domain
MNRRKDGFKEPAVLRELSKPPGDVWPHGALHHGARVALLVLLALVGALLFPSESRRAVAPPQEGAVVHEDIVAVIPFDIPRPARELNLAWAEAEAAVPPIFVYRSEAGDSMAARLDRFFDRLEEAVDEGEVRAVRRVLDLEGISTLEGQAEQFLDPATLRTLRRASATVIREVLPRVLDPNDAEEITTDRIKVRYPSGEERTIPAESLLWGREFYNKGEVELGPSPPDLQTIFRLILISFQESPYVFDFLSTNREREQARQAVSTVEGSVPEEQVIVQRGDRIGESELRVLAAYEEALAEQGLLRTPGRDWLSFFGSLLLNLILLGLFGALLFFYRREVYGNFRWVVLITGLVLAYFLAASIVARQGFPLELLPIAFAVLPVAVLWDGRMALILALVLGVLTGVQPPFSDLYVLVVTLVGGATAALSVRAIRRRAQTWVFISLISLGYTLAILALGFLGRTGLESVLLAIVLAVVNATVSAILAMGFIPVFEWFTGITTDQTLLEWADPNRPLMKRLSMEAGGTYAHTINVANLAESAAAAIGANGLLARVGIYYHDVGKMLKPQYFVENQPGGRNPHDKLKPHTSAAIVREHVIEGMRMAREEGVPEVVVRFIPEHHGTQLIGFFYDKAKEESEEELDSDEFRYPGPKPRSKETAIAMLADSVESAARALQDPSPERVRELVRNIVDGKIQDSQLSEAPLTLREIHLIQEQFVKAMSGMYHQRLDYPATRHLTEAPEEAPESLPPQLPEEVAASASSEAGKEGGEPASPETRKEAEEGSSPKGRREGPGDEA